SASVKADADIDYSADLSVEFNVNAMKLTATPKVDRFSARLKSVEFNADLLNWFKGAIRDDLNRRIQAENPRVQSSMQKAVAKMDKSIDGQQVLKSLADRIRKQIPTMHTNTKLLVGESKHDSMHIPSRIDLRLPGAAAGGVVQELLRQ